TNDQDLDPVDPLGSIWIQDDAGGALLERNVLLDDWFRALLSGYRTIESGEREVTVDLYSNRDPLIWCACEKGALLQYKKQSLSITDLTEFESALREAIIEFTEYYRTHKNWPNCRDLKAMREWAVSKR